ncbi:MAG: ATP-binding cassette domain-containing protein [Candidatus Cloacimonadota bacterium]|nr:ATP-binding cassette domain-containing protein [Candidatus Cloacimonadota bacterium]
MIELESVIIDHRFGKRLKIDNLVFESGCFAQIYAKNGTGKTLLLESIANINKKFIGNVLVNQSIINDKDSIILIERNPVFINRKDVWKNITLPLKKVSREKKRRLIEFCEYANIKALFKQKIETLSYSQKKMVEIIRAVIQYPYVILIDDFDAFFDKEQFKIAKYFLEFASKAGTSIVVSSTKKLDDFEEYSIIDNELIKV